MQKPSARTPTTYSSFPKLQRLTTTAGGFTAGRKIINPESRNATADHIFYREIEKRIEEQRKDLEERNIAVKSLLGHFEYIASMCRDEKNKNIEFRLQNMGLVRENQQLKKYIEEKTAIADKPVAIKRQQTQNFVNTDEYETIWRENDRLKENIKKLEKDLIEKNKEGAGLISQVGNQRLIISNLEKNLGDANMEMNIGKGTKRKYEEEIGNYKNQIEILKETIITYLGQIDKLTEEIDQHDEKNKGLLEEIENKDKEIMKLKSWSSKLSSQHQELVEKKSRESLIISQVLIGPNDNLLTIIDKFTKALNNANDKSTLLERENLHLKDKVLKGSAARKELLSSIEEFRRNNQNDILKYEKMLQQHETSKKIRDAELKDLNESLQRSEAQKRIYIDELQSTEIALYNEKQALAQLQTKYDEAAFNIEKLNIKIASKDEEIFKYMKKMEKYHESKIKYTIVQKEIKAVREENSRLEKVIDSLNTRYFTEKDIWRKEEEVLQQKIQGLQEELNNEKTFNSIHLQEVMKLKRALSSQEFKGNKEQNLEEEKKWKAKIADLETDITEDKEMIIKLQKNINYGNAQLLERNKLITELEFKIQQQWKELSNPNYVQIIEKSIMLNEREIKISSEMQKVYYALEVFEHGLTCFVCNCSLEAAIVLIPCGHMICNKCLDPMNFICGQCKKSIQGHYRIEWLEQLVDKISFQRQVLDSIRLILEKPVFV